MARDGAHAPGAAPYSVTFSDARVVARSERVRASNGNAPASSARTPSRGIAVATTSDGVALAAYVVGGDIEVTRIRPDDGVPFDPTRLRLSSAFDDGDGAPDFSAAHVCWCAHGIDERDVAVLVATCAAGDIHVIDIVALDDGSIAIAGLTRLEMPHSSLSVCPVEYPLLAVATRDSVEVLDLRLRRRGDDAMRREPFATVRHERGGAAAADDDDDGTVEGGAGRGVWRGRLAWLTMRPSSDEYVGPMYAVAFASVVSRGGSRRDGDGSRRDGNGEGDRDGDGDVLRVDVYAWHEETVRKTTGPNAAPRFLDAHRRIAVPLAGRGELRSMASSGDGVLYFTTDARTTMPTLSRSGRSVVNAAFAESARTSFGPADISVSTSGDRRGRGDGDGEMPHIRAPVASNPNDDEAFGLPGAFPKSLVFPQLHRHGSSLEMPPSPSYESSGPPAATAAAAFAVEFNPGRRRGDVSKNGFVVRVVDLPRGLGRPDVLIPPSPAGESRGGRREVLVGSTVGAPRLVAIDASSFDAAANVDLLIAGDSDSGPGGGNGPDRSGGSVRGIDPGVRLCGACRAWQGAGWEGGLALTTTNSSTGASSGSFFFGSVDDAGADAAVSVFRVETTTSNPRRPKSSREATDDVEARARGGSSPLSADVEARAREPQPLSAEAIRALSAVGATPGTDLLESLSSKMFEDEKNGAEQSRGESRDGDGVVENIPGESPARAPPRPYPAFEPGKGLGFNPNPNPEGDGVKITRADAMRSVAAARSALVDGTGKDGVSASLAALMTGLNALGRSVEMRMDRVEAALQAQERRLRRIEAAVTDTSDRGKKA